MAIDVATMIDELPHSSEYDGAEESLDYGRLNRSLRAMVIHVGRSCGYLGDDPIVEISDDGTVVQPPTSEWPEDVQLATIRLACDLYAARNRPGALDIGTYTPRNYQAERLLAPYLAIGFA